MSTPHQRPQESERQIRQQAMVCRKTLKGVTPLTYNTENVYALKELNSSLEILRQTFSAYEMIDEKENLPKSLSDKQIRKKNGTSINGRYLPLRCSPSKKRRTEQSDRLAQDLPSIAVQKESTDV